MQTIYQEKGTQTESEKDTMEEILKAITTLSAKVVGMDKEFQKMKNISQQHDYKHAELRRSEDAKISELKGDVGKLPKTHKIANVAGTSTRAMEKTTSKNTNLNNLFTKPFIPKVQIVDTPTPQTSTYAASLHKEKKTYNHISQAYIENLYKIQNFLNLKPKSTITTEKT